VAALAALSTPTQLWARRPELAQEINETRENHAYSPGLALPDGLATTADLEAVIDGCSALVMAVPSHGFREIYSRIAPRLDDEVPVLSLTKGIEQDTLATMTQIVMEISPDKDPALIGVMTGPNLASEVAAGQPTASVIAMSDPGTARHLQDVFMGPTFRVYTHDDVVGCELGGALKNVMAIAAGMSDGLGFGDNTRATLITRALAELTRLGVTLGGRASTFAGLAGMGDLIATCISTVSRNHQVGFGLASGKTLTEVVTEMRMVAEGVKTTQAVLDLAKRSGIEMPIASHVGHVLYEALDPREAVLMLMTREAKQED
jgi:glycerol-3-phosphate dehydrogenase (NAD(P)+)